MKDIIKVFGVYFALGCGTIIGMGCGMKICDKIIDKIHLQKETKESE